jgi:hypothetical protein
MAHSGEHKSLYSATGTFSTRDEVSPDSERDCNNPELQPLRRLDPALNTSFRQRASLGGLM